MNANKKKFFYTFFTLRTLSELWRVQPKWVLRFGRCAFCWVLVWCEAFCLLGSFLSRCSWSSQSGFRATFFLTFPFVARVNSFCYIYRLCREACFQMNLPRIAPSLVGCRVELATVEGRNEALFDFCLRSVLPFLSASTSSAATCWLWFLSTVRSLLKLLDMDVIIRLRAIRFFVQYLIFLWILATVLTLSAVIGYSAVRCWWYAPIWATISNFWWKLIWFALDLRLADARTNFAQVVFRAETEVELEEFDWIVASTHREQLGCAAACRLSWDDSLSLVEIEFWSTDFDYNCELWLHANVDTVIPWPEIDDCVRLYCWHAKSTFGIGPDRENWLQSQPSSFAHFMVRILMCTQHNRSNCLTKRFGL